ncbi:17010_t:CDS:2 [Dentiscutata erythropus]|uniref:Protein YOP1 n=1 Tax=Dentiscutata erythropus TaxID=1348616 RepID=A0A9N8ZQC8_9GLOM|nr:17010_t:CDS:2 [Dentiscutata erythropus]
MFGYFMYRIVISVAGHLYPAYASFKAIKANDTKSIMSWLIYWIVMALFSVGEGTADNFIFWHVPFLLRNKNDIRAMVDPSANTTTRIYDSYVVPIFTRHEKDIDKVLGMAQEQATNRGAELTKQGLELSIQGLNKLYEGLLKVSR